MKKYMIYCCAGTGGLFLTSVFAQVMGIDVKSNFSASGHAHDMGKGNWKGADSIRFIGDHWSINYRRGFDLYYSHVIEQKFFVDNPGHDIVMITAHPDRYRKITELYVKKAWPDIWTEDEYKKWVGPDYPPYALDNIPNSKIIVDDLVNSLEHTKINHWFELNKNIDADHTVDFDDIMGVNGNDLVGIVEEIVGKTASDETKKYVLDYQRLNQGLYFNV